MSIGIPLPRIDGHAKVTGAARYAAEFSLPGQLHAVPVNATAGLGRITAIHEEPVLALPGVVAVISHKNAPALLIDPIRARSTLRSVSESTCCRTIVSTSTVRLWH